MKAAPHLTAPVTENHRARPHGGFVHSVISRQVPPQHPHYLSIHVLILGVLTPRQKKKDARQSVAAKIIRTLHTRLLIKVQNNPHWMTGVMRQRSMLRCEVRSRDHFVVPTLSRVVLFVFIILSSCPIIPMTSFPAQVEIANSPPWCYEKKLEIIVSS